MTDFSDIRQGLRQLAARYRTSPLAAFLSWWGRELYGMIPQHWRQRLIAPRPQLWLIVDDDGSSLQIWRGGPEPEYLDTFGAGEDVGLLRTRWQNHEAGFREGVPEVSLLLPPDMVLEAPVDLPLAVESNLGPAVSYQLDQLTPFRADQVWHDFHVLERETESGRLRLDLRLVPRNRLTSLFERLAAIGIRPHVLDSAAEMPVGDQSPDRAGFNLLPAEQRRVYIDRRVRLNWALALAAVLMLAVVMGQSLYLRGQGIEKLEAEIAVLRTEAEQVMALQRELEDALDAANFLAEHRREQPVVMHVLDEITRVLPNDLWLQQVQIRGEELTMSGMGNGSQRLIELVNASTLFSETEIRGQVNIDPNTGQERFNARAVITPWGLQDAVAARTRE